MTNKNNKLDMVSMAELDNGYMQSKNQIYFRALSPDLFFSCNKNASFILSNPANSGVNIYINLSTGISLSNSAIRADVYFCVPNNSIKGHLQEVCSVNSSLAPCSLKAKGKMYCGTEIENGGVKGYAFIVPTFEAYRGFPSGTVVVAPGYSHIIEFSTILKPEVGRGALSFAWWEEPICTCK